MCVDNFPTGRQFLCGVPLLVQDLHLLEERRLSGLSSPCTHTPRMHAYPCVHMYAQRERERKVGCTHFLCLPACVRAHSSSRIYTKRNHTLSHKNHSHHTNIHFTEVWPCTRGWGVHIPTKTTTTTTTTTHAPNISNLTSRLCLDAPPDPDPPPWYCTTSARAALRPTPVTSLTPWEGSCSWEQQAPILAHTKTHAYTHIIYTRTQEQ